MTHPSPHRALLRRLARAARRHLAAILIIAVPLTAWGVYRGYHILSGAHSSAAHTFVSLNRTIGIRLYLVGSRLQKWDPEADGHITLETTSAQLSILQSMSWLLDSAGRAAFVRGGPLESYGDQLGDSLRSLHSTLSALSSQIQRIGATTIDRHFVQGIGERLIEVDNQIRLIPNRNEDHHQPWRAWDAAQRQAILEVIQALDDLQWAYHYEGSTVKGTRVAVVSAERAEEIARAHMGPAADALTASETEHINWWVGVHYWRISLTDASEQELYYVMVDAQDGSVLGWWDLRPHSPQAKVPIEQAEASARAYLAANLPGEHLWAGFKDGYEERYGEQHGRWILRYYPQIDGVTYFSDPVTVAVAGPDGQVVGCTKPYRTAPITHPKPDPAPLATAARQSLRERLDAEPQVTAEGWAVRHLSRGGPVLAWAVTAATPQKPGPDLVQAADGSSRLIENPTHLVAFVEASTGRSLSPIDLWLAGDFRSNDPWYERVRR